MTDSSDIDIRLAGLLRDHTDAPTDQAFVDRIIALAGHDLRVRRMRRRAIAQVAREAVALAAVLGAFVLLARIGSNAADFGDMIPLASPAMMGLIMLLVWGLVSGRAQGTPCR